MASADASRFMWRAPDACAGLLLVLLLGSPAAAAGQSEALAARAKQGNDAMVAGRYGEAVTAYAELAKALPNDAGIQLNLGMALAMARRPADAIAPLERAVRLQPDLHPAWLFLGTALLETGKPERAIEPLTRAVATEPDGAQARRMLADAYLTLERYDEASAELRKLTEIDANDATAWYGLGQTHEARARASFQALRDAAPDSPYEALLLADVLASQAEVAEAIALYRDALESLPPLRSLREPLAELYEQAGDAARAAAVRKEAEALSPADCAAQAPECEFHDGRYGAALDRLQGRTDPAAHYWRARIHNELAVEAFGRLERLPPSPESHAFRAQLYRNQGRHLESVAELRRAAALAPGDPDIQRELATSLYLSRDYEAAAPLLEKLLRSDPASGELNFLYGDTLLQAQKGEAAIPHLERAVQAEPAELEARSSLARAYLLVGRFRDAIPHLKAALDIDEDGSLHYQLARAYQAVGESELARKMLAEYEALRKANDR